MHKSGLLLLVFSERAKTSDIAAAASMLCLITIARLTSGDGIVALGNVPPPPPPPPPPRTSWGLGPRQYLSRITGQEYTSLTSG